MTSILGPSSCRSAWIEEVIWAAVWARPLDNILDKAVIVKGKSVGVSGQFPLAQGTRIARGSFIGVRKRPSNVIPIRDSVNAGEGAVWRQSLTVLCGGGKAEEPSVSWSAIDSSVPVFLSHAATSPSWID